MTVGRYQAYLRRSCQNFRKRRDTMLAAIVRYLPEGVSFDPPQGGLFVWLRLPQALSAEELLPMACEEGVAFAPGNIFFPEGSGGQDWMRLNFVAQPVEEIEEGIRRLGRAIQRLQGR